MKTERDLFEQASNLSNEGKYHQAIELYDELLEVAPANLTVVFQRAFCLVKLGRFVEAEVEYRRILDVRPHWAPIYYNLACLLIICRRNDEALEYLDKGLKINPNSRMYFRKAQAFFYTRRIEDAAREVDHAVTLDPLYGPAIKLKDQITKAKERLSRSTMLPEKEMSPDDEKTAKSDTVVAERKSSLWQRLLAANFGTR